MKHIKSHPIWFMIIICVVIGELYTAFTYYPNVSLKFSNIPEILFASVFGTLFIGSVYVLPVMLLIYEAIGLIYESWKTPVKWIRSCDLVALFLGSFYEFMYLLFFKNIEFADWHVQLYNASHHTAIYTKASLTVAMFFIVGIVGYFVLQYIHIENLTPLVAVFSISAMYIGIIQLIVLTVQVFELDATDFDYSELYLLIFPGCCILIAARTMLKKIREWSNSSMEMEKIHEKPILTFFQKMLKNANFWPVLAVLMMIPLLGILIMILMLFGQAPDSYVKAWTETSDWRLSTKQSPPNIYYDEHYLCTVAAGGHKKLVKPIRRGIRHGHEVIVNRQLCVANAFEEVIQEKMPVFHRALRDFYDKYGFPVAKLIRTQWTADLVYIIMKPLEWLFVFILYCVDIHPENRIAVQYMGKVPDYRQ